MTGYALYLTALIISSLGSTSTSMKKKTLNMRDLFVMPNFNEVATIGLNARGGLKRLTKEQLKSVRQTGEFEVTFFLELLKKNPQLSLS